MNSDVEKELPVKQTAENGLWDYFEILQQNETTLTKVSPSQQMQQSTKQSARPPFLFVVAIWHQ